MPDKPKADLRSPELFINRELSLLEFNRRVLEQAKDPDTPLLERLRFLTISSTNLDEFFEIRAAGLKQQVELGLPQRGPDGIGPQETLAAISDVAHELVAEAYRVLNDELLPALTRDGIRLVLRSRWGAPVQRWATRYFKREVLPVLTPMGLDPAHPFPRVLNKGLNFIVTLQGKDAFGRNEGIAVVQVPRPLPRVLPLPADVGKGPFDFVLLSSIIQHGIGNLFPGMSVTGCHQFRVTRNSDLWVDEEETENLLHALKGELPSRNFGEAVRLEVSEGTPKDMTGFLLRSTRLSEADLYEVPGPVNLHRLVHLYESVDRPDLKFPSFLPGVPSALTRDRDMLDVLDRGDVLLHHPFQSFSPVIELVRQAASDDKVLAIKMTLYRTDLDSPLVTALVDAARAGKEVTAVIELRARFDEEANIDLATRLQEVGANVVYGIVGYKAHAKLILIVRREGNRLRRYVHLGTGNYHAGTARAYTDIGYLTARRDLGEDVHALFMQLTGLGKVTKLRRILQSPFTLFKRLKQLIDAEAREARAGRPARIIAKMNSLSDPEIIRALYTASQAGVKVDLIVRGICCLRPGVKGVSDNIRVRSIVGRFLEHSRVFYFHAGGEEALYCASADWMQRNLYRRVETAFPVEDADLRARVVAECLDTYLSDNTRAWILQTDGTYVRTTPGREKAWSAQGRLLNELAG